MNHPVSFVSLGPGDPELITLKALRILQQAEVIYCPATVTGESRAAGMLRTFDLPGTLNLFTLPMKMERTETIRIYRQVMAQITEEYQAGKQVAIAVEGDAGIYASIHYILEELAKNKIPTNQLCGIPSFIAAGAAARLHLISQEERLVIIPGNTTEEELTHYLTNKHVPVIMKLSRCADILHDFIDNNPEYTYHYFENISTEKEYHSCDSEELKKKTFPYFSLMIIQSFHRTKLQ